MELGRVLVLESLDADMRRCQDCCLGEVESYNEPLRGCTSVRPDTARSVLPMRSTCGPVNSTSASSVHLVFAHDPGPFSQGTIEAYISI